jgi:hypothetical protein
MITRSDIIWFLTSDIFYILLFVFSIYALLRLFNGLVAWEKAKHEYAQRHTEKKPVGFDGRRVSKWKVGYCKK